MKIFIFYAFQHISGAYCTQNKNGRNMRPFHPDKPSLPPDIFNPGCFLWEIFTEFDNHGM
jgi:hypothetical protein